MQRLVNLVDPHVETSAATSGETDEACHARLMKLPYLAVSAFAAFFPLRAAEIFSSRALFLISIWGTDSSAAAAPSLSPSSLSLGYLDAQLSEILDFVEEGGRTLLKGIAVHPDILVSATGSDLTYDHYIDRRRQPHKCNMRIVAVKAWEALHDAATEVSSGLNDWLTNRDIKFKASLDVDDASEVSRLRFNSAALSLSDLKAAGVFSKDTFRAVGEHVFEPFPATSEAMETYSVRAFGRAVRPYRSLLKVDQVFYMHAGSMRNARNAQAFVQLDDFCSEKQLDLSATRILPLFEQAELLLTLQRDVRALHNVSVKKLEAELLALRAQNRERHTCMRGTRDPGMHTSHPHRPAPPLQSQMPPAPAFPCTLAARHKARRTPPPTHVPCAAPPCRQTMNLESFVAYDSRFNRWCGATRGDFSFSWSFFRSQMCRVGRRRLDRAYTRRVAWRRPWQSRAGVTHQFLLRLLRLNLTLSPIFRAPCPGVPITWARPATTKP